MQHFIVAPVMPDADEFRQLGGGHIVETVHGFLSQIMLHRYRFPGAQQRAVKHRVGAQHIAPGGCGHIKTPRLDTIIPARKDERKIIAKTRADEHARQAPGHTHFVFNRLLNHRQTIAVGAPLPERFSVAVRNMHFRIRHGLPSIQGRHPNRSVFLTVFKVHRKVSDQHGRAHIHGNIFTQ